MESGFPLPGVAAVPADGDGPRVAVEMATEAQLRDGWSGAYGPPAWETVLGDGTRLRYEIGFGGDHRFRYGADIFHVSPDARTVLCCVQDPDDAHWQRQLLDTILFSVSFAHGFELLHASAVELDDGVVAFLAPTGGGKSSIAAELCRRGHRLFCDDVLAIEWRGEQLVGHPGPAVMSIPRSCGLPASLGASAIAGFPAENETWVALARTATVPLPLRAVYLLDRFAERAHVSELTAPTVLDLLPHTISLPHSPARARSRFELFSALAERVAIFRLAAEPAASAGAIADLVQTSLEGAGRQLAVL